jgi:antitoxin CcdA
MRMKKKGLEDPPSRFRGPPKSTQGRAPQPIGRKPRPKKPLNVSVNAEILKVAKEMKINLSKAVEDTLDRLTVEERARRFYEENKVNIDAHNAYVERHGTLTEQFYGPDAFDDPPP